uniref:EF-hand domain-containing protein n=1 Tax=Chromera velia CCMP2878 TaxID=1169474 RepID=A0A0G4I5T7_9ALVE|eukprot:Cvel_11231.t1-p1 / transcript=Cvel_11231.t1 / gene=Cvel_11231 / organism=Chromera_velia_CCMP2878 / gene_product=hypothetical protein / transcript_product=hypothetical protein / location=Cvel_scaffold699:26718-30379(+) / protein_length=677 / sequence_SO=supercontig / SO=protein_coding / is_pseudo=false
MQAMGDLLDPKEGKGMVDAIVKKWSRKYVYIVRYLETTETKEHRYQVIFSKPTKELPVPIAVVQVYFSICARSKEITYKFENSNLQHKLDMTVQPRAMESWIDRMLGDKMAVRKMKDLTTAFEATRLEEAEEDETEGAEEEAELKEAEDKEKEKEKKKEKEKEALKEKEVQDEEEDEDAVDPEKHFIGGKSATQMPFVEVLSHIFDAADEEEEGRLTHKEVADLLFATPMDLCIWDIRMLLRRAEEHESGTIRFGPFVAQAPAVIEELKARRLAFDKRYPDPLEIPDDAIELCFGEEIAQSESELKPIFEAADPSQEGRLGRHIFKKSLEKKAERFSPQEISMLMQLTAENENSEVPYEGTRDLLEELRFDAFLNATVETDPKGLFAHLLEVLESVWRQESEGDQAGVAMGRDGRIPVYIARETLLRARLLTVSRFQIHTVLCITPSSKDGTMNARQFLQYAVTLIAFMFDRTKLVEQADAIRSEAVAAAERAEQEEFTALTSGKAAKGGGEEDEEEGEEEKASCTDENVQKTLERACNLAESGSNRGTIAWEAFLSVLWGDGQERKFADLKVSDLGLREAELRGFLCEALVDNGELVYSDHIKTWVPIIFEMRNAKVFNQLLDLTWGAESGPQALIDFDEMSAGIPESAFAFLEEGGEEGLSEGSGSEESDESDDD